MVCLIDADSLLYESASVFEDVIDFGDGDVLIEIDEEGAKRDLDKNIQKIVEACESTEYSMFVTGSTNFRYEVLPTYKSNRKDVPKPEMVPMLKEYVLDRHPCKKTSKIEADDACTIMMTRHPEKYILAHIDKDLDQVEGWHYNWRTDEKYFVTHIEGQRFFFKQVLMGDSTDGYGGCHLVGADKAEKIINGYIGVEYYEHTFKRGKRAGETEIRWKDCPMDDLWDAIVSQYLKANYRNGTLSSPDDREGAEQLALQQARVARMLRNEEWVDNEVVLWNYTPLEFDLRKEDE